MKVLLCGEGPHDIGIIDRWSISADRQAEQPGWLQVLLQKIFSCEIEFVIVPRSRLISLPKMGPPLPKGHGTKAYLAKFRALSDKCDLVVFMLDADTADEREWARKRAEVLSGFAAIDREIRAVACVPMSTSESWMLADPAAWDAVSQKKGLKLPKRPEKLWGVRSDPLGKHPHCLFKMKCADANLEDSRETRVLIMESSKIESVKEKCPISFSAFFEDLAA